MPTMAEISLTEEQKKAHDSIIDFFNSKLSAPPVLPLGGYAGTGKTTLISKVVETLKAQEKAPSIAFCAFTGKAATVLNSKLTARGPQDYVGTIHGLIYQPIVKNNMVSRWKRADSIKQDIIVVDEASMVNGDIYRDLISFKKKILAVGDHGQLPPISGEFNLMKNPEIKLEKIHRQAQDNPIIRLSMDVRTDGFIRPGDHGQGVRKIIVSDLPAKVSESFNHSALYLCGYNSTRVFMNKMLRQIMKIKSSNPIKGDKVICLRNNRTVGIYNGMAGILNKLESFDKLTYDAAIKFDIGGEYEGRISKTQFGQKSTPQNWSVFKQGDLFDFGYCLTVHKAQGSESESVVLIEERLPEMEDRIYARWLYTAITRAKTNLLIIKRGEK